MSFMQRFFLRAINFYQVGREGRPSPCRFTPSCSEYSREAVEVHGAARGGWLTARRLLRCRPFGPSGYDPVPDPKPTVSHPTETTLHFSVDQQSPGQDRHSIAPDPIGRPH